MQEDVELSIDIIIKLLRSLYLKLRPIKNTELITVVKHCEWCDGVRKLTKHHVKDKQAKFTGEIMILCRDCHDKIEAQYMREGRIVYGKGRYNKISHKVKIATRQQVMTDEKWNRMYPQFSNILKGQGVKVK